MRKETKRHAYMYIVFEIKFTYNYLLLYIHSVDNNTVKRTITFQNRIMYFFVTECSQDLSLPSILNTSNIACFVRDSCSEIECCIRLDAIQTSLYFYYFLRPCDHVLEVGFENLKHHIPLEDVVTGMCILSYFHAFCR